MRKRNWRQYNKALVQRGSLSFLIDPKCFKDLKPQKRKGPGRPLAFSDQLILMLLMIKIHFKLPYRMLEGFTKYILNGIKLPTYSLTCKRAIKLHLDLPKLSSKRPDTILVDSSGIKVLGQGEWKVKVHGKGRPRKWIKLHLAIDAKTQEIVAELTTDSCIGDPTAFPVLFTQINRGVKKVVADGAYDSGDIRTLIKQQGGKALIPPPKNGVCSGIDADRDKAVLDIRALGGDKIARSIWGKLTGYSRRALVETTFSRYKKMFGEKAFSRTYERQIVENRLKCLLMNKMIRAAA
jgi:Transposase DDE domain